MIKLPTVHHCPYADDYTKAHRDGQQYMLDEVADLFVSVQAERDAALAQNAELAAQVAGRDALLNNLSKWIEQLPVPTKSATSWLMRIDGVMKESPNQALRQIQAGAGRAGFIDGAEYFIDPDKVNLASVAAAADLYADKVRQGGEL